MFDGNVLIFIILLGWFMRCDQHNCGSLHGLNAHLTILDARCPGIFWCAVPRYEMPREETNKMEFDIVETIDYAQWFNLGVTHS